MSLITSRYWFMGSVEAVKQLIHWSPLPYKPTEKNHSFLAIIVGFTSLQKKSFKKVHFLVSDTPQNQSADQKLLN